jgi:trans-aconitate methyltransferase
MIAAGFPLSWAASAWSASLSPLVWLLPLAALAVLYPINAWRDAPLFPTPRGALSELQKHVALNPHAQVLDAGCGLGHGLRELRRVYPQALLHGLEWSWPLRWAAGLICPWARVRRADIWLADWSGYDMVYLFQRPESMPRAYAKAQAELKPGAWLVSLEFPVTSARPTACINIANERSVWIYQMSKPTHAGQPIK